MTLSTRRRTRCARAASVVAAVAAVLLPLGASSAQAATPSHAATPAAAKTQAALPPGVIPIGYSEPCPYRSLCLYRDYGFNGPGYAIAEGYRVNLYDLPLPGGVGGPTAANNASSWVNRTELTAVLLDEGGPVQTLDPHTALEEPPPLNDTVDYVSWAY